MPFANSSTLVGRLAKTELSQKALRQTDDGQEEVHANRDNVVLQEAVVGKEGHTWGVRIF